MDIVNLPNSYQIVSGYILPLDYDWQYEESWKQKNSRRGKSNITSRSQEKNQCELCRNKKRRSLAAYIKNKKKINSCNEIHEEEEEDIDYAKTKDSESININNETTTNRTTEKMNENTNKPKTKTSRFKFWL
ncbi:hypothetical protein PV327_005069 [Microctonus hyperodae]|uniref:Uncharacterized protein n=1 Tax=Microctonus hyperodae TaxID=165561 RepID=A0AA39KZC3_MICHY|nr:hypothetical protein PV327_005069 [Microctonus hyperodae]